MSRVIASPCPDRAPQARLAGIATLRNTTRTRLPMQAGFVRFGHAIAAASPRRITGPVCQSPFGLPFSAAPMTGMRS